MMSLVSKLSSVSARRSYDFLICGAGIVGVNIAAVLAARCPSARIAVLEKETTWGLHSSGRNSGVIHAGMYYHADSLKARLTASGNAFLTHYCQSRGLPLRRCGKLIVAQSEGDLAGLDTLLSRGAANGVPLEDVTALQAARIEPLAKTHRRALFSPTTASADPHAVLGAQLADLRAAGVSVHCGSAVKSLAVADASGGTQPHVRVHVRDASGASAAIETGHLVNCAGLHADTLARALGFAAHCTLLPFIGLDMECTLPLRTLVYPVPDLARPFLGVHFTVTHDGHVKIGPTAIPAAWREQYPEGNWLANFSLREAAGIARTLAAMAVRHADFRALALHELKKYSRQHMVAGAAALVRDAADSAFTHYSRPGIRAQLVDTRSKALVMDFVVEGDALSTHVLNAVSPGWTCSRPFAELVVDRIIAQRGGG